jgi:hypothetical protein
MQMRGGDMKRLIREAMESSNISTTLGGMNTKLESLPTQNLNLFGLQEKSDEVKKIGTFGVAVLAGPVLSVSFSVFTDCREQN